MKLTKSQLKKIIQEELAYVREEEEEETDAETLFGSTHPTVNR